MDIIILFLLNILFMGALWHMDVHHNLDLSGKENTRGIFKMKPEKAYRISQYFLILSLVLTDLLFVVKFYQ